MKRIPQSLHFELTEYASLLRALRTRDALDLTLHLKKQSTHHHKHWTRWPLLLQDLPIPEWSLEDEIAVIASRAHQLPTFTTYQGPLELDDPCLTDYIINSDLQEDDPDHHSHVPYLTSIIASLLSSIFSLLANHSPSRPASMQNRIEPLNWRSVIDVIVAGNLPLNPKVLENVIRRLENIYGTSPNSYQAVERTKIKQAANVNLRKLHQESMATFFSQSSPPPSFKTPLPPTPPPSSPKRKRDQRLTPGERNYKVRKHWVPKPEDAESQAIPGHSREPVRRITRARIKMALPKIDK